MINLPEGFLPVMESFYTIQGEGAHTGKAAHFIRLAGCDVGCTWCDVKESWNVSLDQLRSITELVREVSSSRAETVVITGGEPCMYDLTGIVSALHQLGKKCHLETSGAYLSTTSADWICVSPKKFKAALPEMLAMADELKVVVFHPSDLEWAQSMALHTKEGCQFFLQPEHGKSNKMMPLIVEYVKSNPQWRISLQTHKILNIP
jgi:organic radical activating enzyme